MRASRTSDKTGPGATRAGSDGARRQTALERLQDYLKRLVAEGFFGKVTISFQNGTVHDVRIEQTRKPDEL